MLTLAEKAKLQIQQAVISFALAADAVLIQTAPEDPEPVDLVAYWTSVRNQILAGSGIKAEWLGTLSTEPQYDADDLEAIGFTAAEAARLTAVRDEMRATALALDTD